MLNNANQRSARLNKVNLFFLEFNLKGTVIYKDK